MALSLTAWSSIVDLTSSGQNVSDSFDTAFANIDLAIAQVNTNTSTLAVLTAPAVYADMEPQLDPVAYSKGRFYYDENTETFNLMGPFEGIEVQPGHGEHVHVINNSGATIEAGMAVRAAGVSGGIIQVVKALADTFAHARVLGVAVIDIPNGAESAVATRGILTNLNTNGLAVGVPQYLSDTVAGTYSSTIPAIKTVVGGVFVADATVGVLRLDITPNQNIPTVYAEMRELTTPLINVTTSAVDITNYVAKEEIVTTADLTLGTITLPNDGKYEAVFTANISFPSTTTTRTISLELYDETGAEIHYTYAKNIPRNATEDSLSFSYPIDEAAGNVHKIRVYGSEAIDVTFDTAIFYIKSVSIET